MEDNLFSPLRGWEAPPDEPNLINTDRERERERTGSTFLDVGDQTESREMDRVSTSFSFRLYSVLFSRPESRGRPTPFLSLALVCASYLSLRDKRGLRAQAGKSIKIGLIV